MSHIRKTMENILYSLAKITWFKSESVKQRKKRVLANLILLKLKLQR